MATKELGGSITLSNFDLDNQEMIIAKKMAGKYAEKIRNFTHYQELKLEMKSHIKTRTKKYEIKALLVYDNNRVEAKSQGFNAFVLINEVLQKIIKELENKIKK